MVSIGCDRFAVAIHEDAKSQLQGLHAHQWTSTKATERGRAAGMAVADKIGESMVEAEPRGVGTKEDGRKAKKHIGWEERSSIIRVLFVRSNRLAMSIPPSLVAGKASLVSV